MKLLLKGDKDPFSDASLPIIEHSRDDIQKRCFVRMGCIFPVKLICGELNEDAVAINVSGSGILFVSNREWGMNSVLEVQGKIFKKDMKFNIEIVREESALSKLKEINSYGGIILNICEDNRKHIIKEIFSRNKWLREL